MLSADSPVNKWKPAIRITTLLLICSVSTLVRVFSVIRYESIIHEFDPWFNFRATKFLVNNDFREFWNFFDSESWYPLGRNVGATVYPGLMVYIRLDSPPAASSTSSSTNWPSPSILETSASFWHHASPVSPQSPLTSLPQRSPKSMERDYWQLCSSVLPPATCLVPLPALTIMREWPSSL